MLEHFDFNQDIDWTKLLQGTICNQTGLELFLAQCCAEKFES